MIFVGRVSCYTLSDKSVVIERELTNGWNSLSNEKEYAEDEISPKTLGLNRMNNLSTIIIPLSSSPYAT